MRKASARHLDATRRPSRDAAVPYALRAVMTDACGGDRDVGMPVAVLHGCIATPHAPSKKKTTLLRPSLQRGEAHRSPARTQTRGLEALKWGCGRRYGANALVAL